MTRYIERRRTRLGELACGLVPVDDYKHAQAGVVSSHPTEQEVLALGRAIHEFDAYAIPVSARSGYQWLVVSRAAEDVVSQVMNDLVGASTSAGAPEIDVGTDTLRRELDELLGLYNLADVGA